MGAINLGSLFTSGGRTVISGGSTGLDTEALVKGLTEAKRLPAVKLEDTIKANTEKSDKVTELKTILKTLKDALNFLRNPPGVNNEADNVFEQRVGSVASNTSVAGSNYLSATVAAGTEASSYSITVDQLATKQTRVTNTFALANLSTSAVGGAGPFNAGTLLLGPSATAVTLTAGDTLQEVMDNINAVSTTSGVSVTAVQVSSGNYRLTFKATATGTDQNFDFTTANPGLLNPGFFSETDAVNALVTVDSTQVTRQTNAITDVVDGVTLTLNQVTPLATSLTLDVAPDTALIKDAILNFADAYNAFRVFATEQTATNEDGSLAEGAVLSSSSMLRTIANSLGNEASQSVLSASLDDFEGDATTPFVRNIIKVDEVQLDNALATFFEGVHASLGFTSTSDNANLVVYSRTNALNTGQITYNIDQTNSVYTATFNDGSGSQTVALTAVALTGGGVSLTGPDGSAIEGLVVLFTDTSDAVVTLDVHQGIADRLFNIVNDALDDEDGLVSTELTSLADRNIQLQKNIDSIDAAVERYRNTLLDRFSALEAAVSSVNSLLQLLDAQSNARNNA